MQMTTAVAAYAALTNAAQCNVPARLQQDMRLVLSNSVVDKQM